MDYRFRGRMLDRDITKILNDFCTSKCGDDGYTTDWAYEDAIKKIKNIFEVDPSTVELIGEKEIGLKAVREFSEELLYEISCLIKGTLELSDIENEVELLLNKKKS